MKEFKRVDPKDLVRIQFGTKHSMSFTDTTVEEVMDIAKKVFSDVRINKTIRLDDWCPMNAPSSQVSLVLYVRKEKGGKTNPNYRTAGSKNKTIYGLTGEEAMKMFRERFTKYL